MKVSVLFTFCSLLFLSCNKKGDDQIPVPKGFAFQIQTDPATNHLYYISSNGGSFGQVTADNLGKNLNKPTWSADGRRILFVKNSSDAGVNGVYSIKSNGTEMTPVYKDNDQQSRQYGQLCSSSDNEYIVFSMEIPRGDRKVTELFTMCPCGQRVVRLTEIETQRQPFINTESYSGSFSPLDTALVFSQSDPTINGLKTVNIYTINIKTKTLRLITAFKAADVASCAPSYSPDGTKFLLSIDGLLHTMNGDGSDLKPLGSLRGFRPVWDSNGKDFYFSSGPLTDLAPGIYKSNIYVTSIEKINRDAVNGIVGAVDVNL